jgi:hypothetical protein
MSRKIRETVALRRFNATLLPADRTDDGAAVIAEHPSEPAN